MTVKLGCIGTSNTDSYRGSDNRGIANSLSWLESLIRLRDVDCGAWESNSEPRRTDYARNWARSASNTSTMISQGQHTGLAGMLDSSTYVVIEQGNNDILPSAYNWGRFTFETIQNDSSHAASYYANQITADLTTAIETVLAANPAGLVVWDYFELTQEPGIISTFTDATKRLRVKAVIDAVNVWIRANAATYGYAIARYEDFWHDLYGRASLTSYATIDVWGHTLTWDLNDDPSYYRIADNHLGTVLSWAMAGMVIDALRTLGVDLPRARPYDVFDLVGFTGSPRGSIRRA